MYGLFPMDAPGSLSTGLDELIVMLLHSAWSRVDMLMEILFTISKIGHGVEAPSLATESIGCSAPPNGNRCVRKVHEIFDVLKDFGIAYKEIIWQISLADDSKVEEKMEDREVVTKNATLSVISGNGDDANVVPMVRYMNPVSTSQTIPNRMEWEEEILSVFRSVRSL
ncbi:hypothetical protein IFM89_025673 [Coptis chinensis]|uniref:Uncharacterized protein n=1 Tax=Coptis chinensis TaxID=261450 RepID=A0A835HMJ6_9MAGN|nr:hypothetical protein IFM89_025673 [Coptis chinensis]